MLFSNLIIASLGSSFASGPGIAPQVNPIAAGRSASNYAHLLAARRPNATLTDLSVSGATLLNVLNTTQTVGSTSLPPQIQGLAGNEDLLLVLGGGNDVGYIASLFMDSNTTVDTAFLAGRYGVVLDALHAKSPRARIIVITYLTVLGADVAPQGSPGANVPFSPSRVTYHQGTAAKLREATLKAVVGREAWAEVLDVVEPSWGHGVGSKEPWVNGSDVPPGGVRYHPRAEGHVAVADLLAERVGKMELGSGSGTGMRL